MRRDGTCVEASVSKMRILLGKKITLVGVHGMFRIRRCWKPTRGFTVPHLHRSNGFDWLRDEGR